jgi:hypothetical protein
MAARGAPRQRKGGRRRLEEWVCERERDTIWAEKDPMEDKVGFLCDGLLILFFKNKNKKSVLSKNLSSNPDFRVVIAKTAQTDLDRFSWFTEI